MKYLKKSTLSRRTLLRGALGGAVIGLALPTLEIMLGPHGETLAQGGQPLPKLFVNWFFGNGWMSPRLLPASEGRGWGATPQLQPLADAGVLGDVSVGHGFKLTWDGSWAAHKTTYAGLLSCAVVKAEFKDDPNVAIGHGGPTLVELISQRFRGRTTHDSVACGISRNNTWGSAIRPQEYGLTNDPRKLWDHLFGGSDVGTGTNDDGAAALRRQRLAAAEMTMVDVVRQDAQALRTRMLGQEDRHRLDAHLEMLDSLERRLQAQATPPNDDPQRCLVPTRPAPMPRYVDDGEELDRINRDISDVLVAAMACDLSRVYDVRFSKPQTNTIFKNFVSGATLGQHTITHDHQANTHHQCVVFVMEQLAYLLQRMKATEAAPGKSLLHQAGVLVGSEIDAGEDASRHSHDGKLSFLVAGHAGGKLKPGAFVQDLRKRRPLSQAHMTLLRALDVPNVTHFGENTGSSSEMKTSDVISEFMA